MLAFSSTCSAWILSGRRPQFIGVKVGQKPEFPSCFILYCSKGKLGTKYRRQTTVGSRHRPGGRRSRTPWWHLSQRGDNKSSSCGEATFQYVKCYPWNLWYISLLLLQSPKISHSLVISHHLLKVLSLQPPGCTWRKITSNKINWWNSFVTSKKLYQNPC